MKQTSIPSHTTNLRKASLVYRSAIAIAIAIALLGASVCVQAGAIECSHKAQALGKCPQPVMREAAPTSALPRTTASETTRITDTAGKHAIIFVGGRVGSQSDTHMINSQPVPPGHSPDTRSINSQPVPPGRAAHKHPLPGEPIERTRHSNPDQHVQVRS